MSELTKHVVPFVSIIAKVNEANRSKNVKEEIGSKI